MRGKGKCKAREDLGHADCNKLNVRAPYVCMPFALGGGGEMLGVVYGVLVVNTNGVST